jgi:pimeloyl-ACP methyl ester carboxylesterase
MLPIMTSSTSGSARQPVILLHSGGFSARQWRKLGEALGPTHRVLAPDFLGAGDNPPWPDEAPFDFGMDVDLIERLLDEAGEPAHLVGHSYGGLVALTLARRRPGRIRSLTAYDPVAFGVLHGTAEEAALRDLDRLGSEAPIFLDPARGGGEAWFEVFVDYWNGPGAWRALPQPTRDAFLRVGRKVFYEVLSLMKDRTPAAAYGTIEAPALLLTGEKSPPAARGVVALLAAAFPRGRSHVVEGAGHMGPISHAGAVNAEILRHILAAS